jgi:hypothetical protein
MNRLLPLVLAFTVHGILAQAPVVEPSVVNVTWRDVFDQFGHKRNVPVMAMSSEDVPADHPRVSYRDHGRVVAQDDRWRQARVAHDAEALEQILTERFVETGQDGNSRSRAEALRNWSNTDISSLVVDTATIRISGDVATMTGEQLESKGAGAERQSFQRVYLRIATDEWKLLSSVQFKKPTG